MSKFEVSKKVEHGFRVLGPASPEQILRAKEALNKVKRDREERIARRSNLR